jgi:hypothetical protein
LRGCCRGGPECCVLWLAAFDSVFAMIVGRVSAHCRSCAPAAARCLSERTSAAANAPPGTPRTTAPRS